MDENNRKILVQQQIEKSEKFLNQADNMIDQQFWDLAANRYYYACYHVVQGLFIAKGISAHTHAGIIAQFSLNFVKTNVVASQYGSFLSRLMQLRQKADYNCAYDISESEVRDIVGLAHDFVGVVKNLILNK